MNSKINLRDMGCEDVKLMGLCRPKMASFILGFLNL
jgi:hypothetical protein